MNALAYLPAAQYVPGERVIAQPQNRASADALRRGGSGEVTGATDAGGGDFWIWVRLDGADADYPFLASQLRKEPTI